MPAPRYCRRAAKRTRGLVQPRAQRRVQSRRRRLLDQLLVAALHRAIALAEMDDMRRRRRRGPALRRGAPLVDEALQVHARVAESRARLGRGQYPVPRPDPASASTRFMPRPPPPPTALISSGTPMLRASSLRFLASGHGAARQPPAHRPLRPRRARAACRPRRRAAPTVGPMKMRPLLLAQASRSAARSERKP